MARRRVLADQLGAGLFATQDPPTLDPYISTSFRGQPFAAFIYSRLLMSKKGPGIATNAYIMEGDLAESWHHSDDGMTVPGHHSPGLCRRIRETL